MGGALHLALANRDLEAADSLAFNGLRLVAKWPAYLAALDASKVERSDP